MESDPYEKVMELARITQVGVLWHCLCAISRLQIPDIIADKSLSIPEVAALARVHDGGGLNRSKQFRPVDSRFPEAVAPRILRLAF